MSIRRVRENRPTHHPDTDPPASRPHRRLVGTGLYVLSLLALAWLILAPSIATIAAVLVVGVPAGWLLMDPGATSGEPGETT